MSVRFTDDDKWDDKWYRNLEPLEKLVFNFLCDRCDLAGFYEIDIEDMEFRIKANKSEVLGACKGLTRGLYTPGEIEDGAIIWIKNFLKHQKNIPLNPANNAHKHIFKLISKRKDFHSFILKYLGGKEGLISPTGKGISKGRGNSKGKSSNWDKIIEDTFENTIPANKRG